MTAQRMKLGNRRRQYTETVNYNGAALKVSFGFDTEWQVREIFARGPKVGSDMEALVDDACVILSLLLQHGAAPAAIVKSLGRDGTLRADLPPGELDPSAPERMASVVGFLAQLLTTARHPEDPGQTIAGLDQLAGETVQVLADGAPPPASGD